MLFTSREATISHVVKPADYAVEGGKKSLIRGLRADFRNHQFDSAWAQKQLNWTDEQREAVENYLLNHPSFGRSMWSNERKKGGGKRKSEPPQGKVRCIATVAVQGEASLCGQPVVEGLDLCAEHAKAEAAALATAE